MIYVAGLGPGGAEMRTAAATEESARQQKETNKHLKKIENSSTSITYGD